MSRLLLPTVSFALLLVACVPDGADTGFTILRNVAPAGECEIDPSSSVFRPAGRIQSDSVLGYFFTPAVRNDIILLEGDQESQKAIFVGGAHVTITFRDADFFSDGDLDRLETDGLSKFEVPTSGAIDPGGGVAAFGFDIVPFDLLHEIDAKLPEPSEDNPTPILLLDVAVQMFGTRAGGDIESNVFHYPVEVCRDCAVHFVGSCEALPQGFEGSTGGACNTLQDGVLECCTNALGSTVCPAAVPGTQT